MGFLDDFFDTKVYDSDKTKINYKPPKLSDFKLPMKKNSRKVQEKIEKEKESHLVKDVATSIYVNCIDWCICMKGSHIHKKCVEEIFNKLPSRVGVPYCEFIETLDIDWGDYWYDTKNHRQYTRTQLKRIEREFDDGKDSDELVYDMLNFVWFSMIPKGMEYEDIDEIGIYKMSVKWRK